MTCQLRAIPIAIVMASALVTMACNPQASKPTPGASPVLTSRAAADSARPACVLVADGFGPLDTTEIRVEQVVDGLAIPWGIAFLPDGDALVSERDGDLRLVRDIAGDARLEPTAVARMDTGNSSEGGLLGIALHPDFASNRLFYLYVTIEAGGTVANRIERWRLAESNATAALDRVIYAGIPAARFHNGGRLRFGPDGMLYVGTGDARDPELSRDPQSPAGALLRLTPDGTIPADNPWPGSPVYLSGLRNTQGWDWPVAGDASTLWITDHGPSGDTGRRGHDEVSIAKAGDDLGWPTIYSCEEQDGLVTPVLTWEEAAPPGGAAIYTGSAIPEWRGSLIVGTLGSRHLHVVRIERGSVARHGGTLDGEYGRLREVIMGPDDELYVTTSNCDGRGDCGDRKDMILRITR